MNFEEVGERYTLIKVQYDNSAISVQEFERLVKELVAVAPDGKRWYIDPHAGTWVELGSVKPPPVSAPAQAKAPETLLQLFSQMAKGLLKSIPRMIMIGLLMSVLTWVAHTYLIAKVNDGLMYNSARIALNSVVHLQQTYFPGVNAFWGLLAYFLSSFFMKAVSMGPRKWLDHIVQSPKHIQQSISRSRERAPGPIILGAFMALLVALLYRNFMLSWVLFVGFLLIMTAHFQGLEVTVLRLGLSDLQKLMNRRIVREGEEYDMIYLVLLGMTGGFFLVGLWRAKFIITLICSLLFLLAYILLKVKGTQKAAALLVLAGGALLFLENPVFAWCEGGSLSQVGGSWTAWWNSPNADLVRGLGIAPAAASFLGSLVGSAAAAVNSEAAPSNDASGKQPPEVDDSIDAGGPDDNPFTSFNGGDGPAPCSEYGLPNYWVNTAALNLVVRDTVFASAGVGPAVNLTMTYNSLTALAGGMFGLGWRFSYEWLLEINSDQAVIRKGSGQSISFTAAAASSAAQPVELQPPDGLYHRFISYGEYWLFMEKDSWLYYRFDRSAGTNLARLTAIGDVYGNTVQLGYDTRGNLASISDAAGRTIHFSYNDANLCTTFVLPDGRQAEYAYDTKGRLIQAVDLLGVVAEYRYDDDNCLTAMIVGRSRRTICFSYCRAGRRRLLETVTDANGCMTRYELLSGQPRQVRVTDPGGAQSVYHSSGGLTEAITGPLGHCLQFAYANGMPISCRDQNGQITLWEYDEQGRLTAETDASGYKAVFAYDRLGNLVQAADPLGGCWRYDYDQSSNLTGITTPAGRTLTMEYDSRGLLVASTGFDGGKTEFLRDRFGNMLQVRDPLGHALTFAYDEHGYMLASVMDPLSHTTQFEFDANQRPIRYIYPDGTENSLNYDCCFLVHATDENRNSIALERDAGGNVIRFHHTADFSVDFRYDHSGRLLSAGDGLGRDTFYDYDAARRLSRMTDPLGQSRSFEYDPAGNLISLMAPGGRRTLFSYDPCHRKISTTDPLGSVTRLQRDALGRVISLTNARGGRTEFLFEADSLPEKVLYDGVEAVSYRYNAAGRLSEMRDGSGSTSFAYDQMGRVAQISYPEEMSLAYQYDAVGNISTITYPGDLTVQYAYDSRKRIEQIQWGGNWLKFEYDDAGNLIREVRSNGTESRYSYDPYDRIAELAHLRGEEPFIRRCFTRDAAGNILKESGVQPLVPPADSVFTMTCNAADQALGEDPAYFRYDADGNLIAAGEGWAAGYDAENRLIELTRDSLVTRYLYNGLGQRVRVTSQCGERSRCYDPAGNLLFETAEDGKVMRYFLYFGGRPVALVEQLAGSYFYHYDQLGSTLALTGEDGAIAAAYAYSPFGLAAAEGMEGVNPFTYCGASGIISDGDGLYFMNRRCYAARWGRFVQKDPLGISGGMNLYAYAANNPLKYIDPDGTLALEAWLVWKTVGAVVGVVTVAAAGYKTVTSAYTTAKEFNKRNQAVGQMQKAFKNYADIVDDNKSTLAAREEAYQKYEQAYNQVTQAHNNMLNGAEAAVTGAVETGIDAATPDFLNVPALLVTPAGSAKDRKCSGAGAGGYFIRKSPRLPFHHVMNL